MKVNGLPEIVIHGSEELGIKLPPGAGAVFDAYYNLLEKCGRSTNLTAIKGTQDVARLHFLDSIALLKTGWFKNARVIDIGSGAGFPGVPMKIAEPSVKLTLIDATEKRVAFLSDLCAALGLDAACIHERAEEAALDPDMREKFDVAVSRAVARLDALCELCLPFVCVGGVFIAMKGADPSEELAQSQNAIDTLGAKMQEYFEYAIPGTDIIRRAVIIRKVRNSPDKYPRRFARIQKAPL